MLVILVPVLFGLIGFAVDLGMLYVAKGELKAAANSMALAAAQKLIGTDASTGSAAAAAQLTIENSSGFGNKYNFNGLPIGQTTRTLTSMVAEPAFFSTVADAVASDAFNGGSAGGSLARHVRVTVTGQAPLIFWSFLPTVTDRNISVLATAVAGMSAPLCVACGIEPFAVGARDQSDTTDFGFLTGTKYSFVYLCNGTPPPTTLPGAGPSVNYLLLNRLDTNAVVLADESSQAFRDGAGGVPGNNNSAQACFTINNAEAIWASATPRQCNANQVAPVVAAAMCGLDTRFESATPAICSAIPDADTLASIYQPDTDVDDHDVYTDYTGTGRRIITVPIVDNINAAGFMTVIGFRQFLVLPAQGGASINPGDQFGRFAAMYIGSAAPVKQGRFDGCQQTAGPGKVVLHQ